jgi:hypothetical protein
MADPRDLRPASHIQRRIWRMHQRQPDAQLYTLYHAAWLTGPLDLGSLALAMRQLQVRHESLRTSLHEDAAVPCRLIHPVSRAAESNMTVLDVAESAADAVVSRWLRQPWRLEEADRLRVGLLRGGPQRHLLLLAFHHLNADGRSVEILVRDLADEYARAACGQRNDAYADAGYDAYVGHEAEVLATQGAELAHYWRGRLTGAPTTITPCPGSAHPPVACRVALPTDCALALRRLAREERVSPFMVGLAAYAAFLSRLCGRREVVIGTPVDLRAEFGLEDLVGPCVNLVPLRITVPAGSTARQLLAAVRDAVLDDLTHALLPFDLIVAQAWPERRAAVHPLVQATFQLTAGSQVPVRLPGLRTEPYRAPDWVEADFGAFARPALDADFTMQARLFVDDGISGFLRLRCARPQAQRLANAFGAVLGGFVTAPDADLVDGPDVSSVGG